MDLSITLKLRIESLPKGNYTQGLDSIVQHIEVASRHLLRGQDTSDETAFTDSIYRTNQAFEGSLKEAFRVLAGKDPEKVRPFDIVKYFQEENILRPRVLSQFTNYRKEWRNPSAHDYRLDFDEDEALLAIVNVSAFAIVLVDQITEYIAFEKAREIAMSQKISTEKYPSFVDRIIDLIEKFTIQFNQTHKDFSKVREVELIGSLSGFLSSTAPDVTSCLDAKLSPEKAARVDLLLISGKEKIILEVKLLRGSKLVGSRTQACIHQASTYMSMSDITQSIVYVYNIPNTGKLVCIKHTPLGSNGEIIIISTETNAG